MSKIKALMQRYDDEANELRARREQLVADIVAIDGKLQIVEAKLAGIVEAQEAMGTVQPAKRVQRATGTRRRRGLGEVWQGILREADVVGTFGYVDLERIASEAGHQIARDNHRSQMSLYKTAGIVKSVGQGSFRLTDAGREAAGIIEPNENGALNGHAVSAPETEGAATPSIDDRMPAGWR